MERLKRGSGQPAKRSSSSELARSKRLEYAFFAAIAVLKVENLGFFLPDLFYASIRSWSKHSKSARGLGRASILANEQKIG